MWNERYSQALTALMGITVSLLLTACGPRISAVHSETTEKLMISLPSLVIDVQSDGEMLVGGQTISEIGSALGQDLSVGSLDPALVDFLTQGAIQHIQIDNSPDGPRLLINGEPIPSIGWDGDSLASLAVALELFGVQSPGLNELLPLVKDLGVGLTIRLPVPVGVEPIPLHVTGEDSSAARAEAGRAAWLEAIGNQPLHFQLELNFDNNGVATVGGIGQGWLSDLDLPLSGLNQPPEVIQSIRDLGIDRLSLASNEDGIGLLLNDDELPSVTWGEGEVTHLLRIGLQAGLQEPLSDMDPNVIRLLTTAERWLPAVQSTEVQLSVNFNE